MKAILQRVTFAEVKVDGNTVGKIDNGFLILLGVAEGDTEKRQTHFRQRLQLCGYLPTKTIK